MMKVGAYTIFSDICHVKQCSVLGLYIIYFKRYDIYHDTHEMIFDIHVSMIHFVKKCLICPQISLGLEILMTKIP